MVIYQTFQGTFFQELNLSLASKLGLQVSIFWFCHLLLLVLTFKGFEKGFHDICELRDAIKSKASLAALLYILHVWPFFFSHCSHSSQVLTHKDHWDSSRTEAKSPRVKKSWHSSSFLKNYWTHKMFKWSHDQSVAFQNRIYVLKYFARNQKLLISMSSYCSKITQIS